MLERSVDDVVAWAFSLSSSAPHLFGARREDFEADLRGLLRSESPAGRFSERQPGTEVFVRYGSAFWPVSAPTAQDVNQECGSNSLDRVIRIP